MPLLNKFPKELTFGVLLMLHIVDVGRDVNNVFFESVDDSVIGEYGCTARDAIVSDTPQRVAIHRPDKNRFLVFVRQLKARPKAGDPSNFTPLFLGIGRANKIENGFEILFVFESRIHGSQHGFRILT
jgi:hypothetical protein